MRNRKKWKFIGKNREDNISKFDRQTINRYPGKRLPMRRRSLNPIRNTWFYKYNVWIPSKYIEGLLTKYIGKPYSEFKRKYDERTQSIRDKGVNTDKELSTYFNPRYNPDFYVDNDGFIQVARKNSFWDNYKKYSEYMKVIVLNYSNGEVYIENVPKELENLDGEDIIMRMGYDIDNCSWMFKDHLNIHIDV